MKPKPTKTRVKELENFLRDAIAYIDEMAGRLASPTDRIVAECLDTLVHDMQQLQQGANPKRLLTYGKFAKKIEVE